MNKNSYIKYLLLLLFVLVSTYVMAQECLGPVRFNPWVRKSNNKTYFAKTTASLSLPFFEDFTNYSVLPDSNKWVDNEVYINNTMCVSPISRGVATLDDLNKFGLPYDTLNNTNFTYADSLTSQPIDLALSTVTPADSLYLSFFYQAQGNGFYPQPQDSLMLYLKNIYGNYIKVWSIPGPDSGATIQPFKQVMIPITDSLFFGGSFQFRFVNIAAADWADAIWNIDYIRLNKNRFAGDTTIGDVAFTSNPTFLLNDYTYMPYSQFMADTFGEVAHTVTDSIRVDTAASQTVTGITMQVTNLNSGAFICPPVTTSAFIQGYQIAPITQAYTTVGYPTYPPNSVVNFETKYYFQSSASTGNTINDTIVKNQVFDNYLAYDDGTAERAYYLIMDHSGAIPAEIEMEYHLNHPDTLFGMAIYFARQVPLADYKEFYIKIYSSLIGVNGYYVDNLLAQQDFLFPVYIDTVNNFYTYTLDTPILLPAGTFYAGTVQPAYSASDSLYFGFDVNRIGGNHTYFRVQGSGKTWNPSLFNGVVMMRPVLGHINNSSAVKKLLYPKETWHIAPVPAGNEINLFFDGDDLGSYYISDLQGRTMYSGKTTSGKSLDISKLSPGTYIVSLTTNGIKHTPLKFIKI